MELFGSKSPRLAGFNLPHPTRLGVAVAVLLLSGVVALRARPMEMAIVSAAVGCAILLAVVSRRPAMGLVLVLASGLVVPLGLDTGTYTRVSISLVLLMGMTALWLGQALLGKGKLMPSSRTVAPLLGFMGIAVLAFGFGQQPWFVFAEGAPTRAQLGGLATFLLSGAAFLLASNYFQERGARNLTVWLFIAVGGAIAAARLQPGLSEVANYLARRPMFGSLFWTWLAAMAAGQAILNPGLRNSVRFLLLGIVASIFFINVVQASSWVSGWIPPLISVLVVALLAFPKPPAATALVALAIGFVKRSLILDMVIGANTYSLNTRIAAWRILGEIVRVNPVFGLGPANYYWYAPLFPILGYSVRFSSHNNYVDIVAQTGFLGLSFFIWFLVAVALVGFRMMKSVPDGFDRAYSAGALGGLAGTLAAGMLGDWIIPFVYNVGLDGLRASLVGWIFLGGLVALEASSGRETRSGKVAADSWVQ